MGFIAQEVKDVLPGLVSVEKPRVDEDDDRALHAMNYSGVIPVLVEAVKEQQKIIDDLKVQIEKLKDGSDQTKLILELLKRVEQLESSKKTDDSQSADIESADEEWQGAPYLDE